MSINIKPNSWKSMVSLVKRNGSWQVVKKIYVKKSGSSVSASGLDTSWGLVYGIEDARPTDRLDNQVSGTYGFVDFSKTYDNSLGDTSTYGYSQATTGETINEGDSNNSCQPTVVGSSGDGYTIFSFDPGYSVEQNEAVINIKYKRSGSVSQVNTSGGNVTASISYSTDATNNTGSGTYINLQSCTSTTSDATFQTIQTTVVGLLNRQNFKIKVSAKESLFIHITAFGNCDTPPPYEFATKSAAFLISDIYVTFR